MARYQFIVSGTPSPRRQRLPRTRRGAGVRPGGHVPARRAPRPGRGAVRRGPSRRSRSDAAGDATDPRMNPPAGRPLVWSWSLALLGALCSVPAVIVTVSQPSRGLALAFGVLPAAAVGIQGPRRRRYTTLIPGVAIGACLTLGAALATHAALAVSGVFLLALGSAMLADRPAGRLLMVLALPMVGAGLSFTDVATAAELAGLMVLGSVYGWLLTLAWPERPAHVRAPPATPSRGALLDYGIRLGLAGALCTGVGFALDLDHKGWATAACLLVMRPTPEMTPPARRRPGARRYVGSARRVPARPCRPPVCGARPDRVRRPDRPCGHPAQPLVRHRRLHDLPRDLASALRQPATGPDPVRRAGTRDAARRGRGIDLRRRDTGSAHQGETVGSVDAPVEQPHQPDSSGERPLTVFPLVRGRSGWWWRVEDSNLCSFRDGFTVRSHWPLGQPAGCARGADGSIRQRGAGPLQGPGRGGSDGRPVVRHREQGRPAGGRQRPQPGREGALAAVRLPRHGHRRSPGRARRRSASSRRPRSGRRPPSRSSRRS